MWEQHKKKQFGHYCMLSLSTTQISNYAKCDVAHNHKLPMQAILGEELNLQYLDDALLKSIPQELKHFIICISHIIDYHLSTFESGVH